MDAGAQNNTSQINFSTLRAEAQTKFLSQGFPRSHEEDWKYTNLKQLQVPRFSSYPEQNTLTNLEIDVINQQIAKLSELPSLTFLNGEYSDSLSNFVGWKLENNPDFCRYTLEGSCEVLIINFDSISKEKSLISKLGFDIENFGSLVREFENSLTHLNNSSFKQLCLIKVFKDKKVPLPINFNFIESFSNAAEGNITALRTMMFLEEGSELEVSELHSSLNELPYLKTQIIEAYIKEGAILSYTKFQNENYQTSHFSTCIAELGSNSKFVSNLFSLGSKLARNEIFPILKGENINCYLNGLSILEEEQKVDNFTVIDHTQPNSESTEIYKGVYADNSEGTFSGTIIVRKDAQKTNAIQSNNSVLLSEQARVNTRPQLKIWADDVKCTHGATIGQIDEDALFYLRSRGIPEKMAKGILVKGFVLEVLERISTPQLKACIEAEVISKLQRIV